jgi:hypothetical protein
MVSEEYAASIFRVTEFLSCRCRIELARTFVNYVGSKVFFSITIESIGTEFSRPEVGGSTFFRNSGIDIFVHYGVIKWKTMICATKVEET